MVQEPPQEPLRGPTRENTLAIVLTIDLLTPSSKEPSSADLQLLMRMMLKTTYIMLRFSLVLENGPEIIPNLKLLETHQILLKPMQQQRTSLYLRVS